MKNQQTMPELTIVQQASITDAERKLIELCRGHHNRLGFCYQMMFVKIFNRFPTQNPLEIQEQIITFASLQLNISVNQIENYRTRQPTISEHQTKIRTFLKLKILDTKSTKELNQFLFSEAQRTENRGVILSKTEQFLKEHSLLRPSTDTLERLIAKARQKAHQYIYKKVFDSLTKKEKEILDDLVKAVKQPEGTKELYISSNQNVHKEDRPTTLSESLEENRYIGSETSQYFSKLQKLKNPPGHPSAKSLLALTEKLKLIESTQMLNLDINWINNNYKRELAKYVLRCSSKRIRELTPAHRYTALVCYLNQLSLDTKDQMIDLHHKLMLKVYKWANNEKNEATQKKYKHFKKSQMFLSTLSRLILDKNVRNADLRNNIFQEIDRETLKKHMNEMNNWFSGKYSHLLNLVVDRFSYIRQFSPSFLSSLEFVAHGKKSKNILEAINVLKTINHLGKRILPNNTPINFIPKKIRPLVISGNVINKKTWECALLSCIQEEIKVGNLTIKDSKRFGPFDDFFMPEKDWERIRHKFFERSKLPENPKDAVAYLSQKHINAVDNFLIQQKGNSYVKIENNKFVLSVDPSEIITKKGPVLGKLRKRPRNFYTGNLCITFSYFS